MSRGRRPGGKLRDVRAAGPTVDLDEAQAAKMVRLMSHYGIKSKAGRLRRLLDDAIEPGLA